MNDSVKLLVTQAVSQLNTILETLSSIRDEMNRIAAANKFLRIYFAKANQVLISQ